MQQELGGAHLEGKLGQVLYVCWEGGAEQQGLPHILGGQILQDLDNGRLESHVQQIVCFITHQHPQLTHHALQQDA